MIKFFQRRIVRVKSIFHLLPKPKTVSSEAIQPSSIYHAHNIHDYLTHYKLKEYTQDTIDNFKEKYHDELKEIVNRIDLNSEPKTEQIENINNDLYSLVNAHSKAFHLEDIEICLAILNAIISPSKAPNKNIISLLEERFNFLANNRILPSKLFEKTFVCLEYFSLINLKLNNQEYIEHWNSRAFENLKFYSNSQIASLVYISSVQIQQKPDIYHEIKLQLFKNTSLYLKEFVKIKLGLDTSDIKNPGKFLKEIVSRIFLTNYERKGLYWSKDFEFRVDDNLKLVRAYNNFNDKDSDFLVYLAGSTLQNFYDSLQNGEDKLDYVVIFEVLKEFSSAIQRVKPSEEIFQQLMEALLSLTVRAIPNCNISKLDQICSALLGLEGMEFHATKIHLIKTQISFILNKELISQRFDNFYFHLSFLNIMSYIIGSKKDPVINSRYQSHSIFGIYLNHFDKKSIEIVLDMPEIFNHIFHIGIQYKIALDFFNKFLELLTQISLSGKPINTKCAISLLYANSFIEPKNAKIRQENIELLLDFIINKSEISDFNQTLLLYFFSSYRNFLNPISQLKESSKVKLELLRDVLLRYFADHYQEFELEIFEAIFKECIASELHQIGFDDGSKLYDKTLTEELEEYTQKNYKSFSEEFQKTIRELYPPKESILEEILKS